MDSAHADQQERRRPEREADREPVEQRRGGSDEEALRNAVRFVKEAGADAVKLEGAGPTLSRVQAIVGAGIPVMGHIGLTPQSATLLGGFMAQGRTAQ